MKKLLLLFVLCSILLTGCVVDKVDVVEISNEKGMASVKSVTRQTDRMPENMALYENKLLYSMSNYGIEIFYTLDFQTGTIELLGETDIRGKEIWGAALVDDTFYFYAEETDTNTNSRLNVLYGCDLVDSALLRISQNKNGKSRIPLISFENK